MIKDLLVSFRDNFKEKTRNPFLGTYILVWCTRNWQIVFAVFNFDDDFTLQNKIDFINQYYETTNFIWDLAINILITFAVLVSTYILLNISRLIVNFSEKQITPYIYKITDSKSIVLKEIYDRVITEREELRTRFENERESKSSQEKIIVSLTESIGDKEGQIEKLKDEISSMIETGTVKVEILEDSHKEIADVKNLIEDLKEKNYLNRFHDIARKIDTSQNFKRGETNEDEMQYFINKNIIEFDENSETKITKDTVSLKLTSIGKKILDKLKDENLSRTSDLMDKLK